MRAAFVGRFQPLHLGHVRVLEWISQNHDDVLVIIGSADKGVTRDNPFTAGERIEMFLRVFGRRFTVCTVPDTGGSSSLWGALVRHWCPRLDLAYSNNGFVKAALGYAGVEVKPHPVFDRLNLSGRHIRQLIAKGSEGWRDLVPAQVADVIEEVDGIRRIRELFEEG